MMYSTHYSVNNRMIKCPHCGKPAIKMDGVVQWYCYNCDRIFKYTTEETTSGTEIVIA